MKDPEPAVGDAEDPERTLLGAAPAQPGGDRGRPAVQSAKSVQARMSRVLAGLLLGGLTAGLLVWYYARAFHKPTERRAHAQTLTQNKAKGEMNLPPLGSLETFRHALRTHRVSDAPASNPGSAWSEMSLPGLASASSGPGDGSPASSDIVPVPLAPTKPAGTPVAVTGSRTGGRRVSAEERRLGGRVFAAACGTCGAAGSGASMGSAAADSASTELPSAGHAPTQPVPSAGPAAPQVLQPEWLMPKGWVLECTLETAIDSTLPGLTTCVMPVDVLGADGRRVLLPRGTQLVGETRGSVRQGQARIAVLWSEARTPAGAIVNLGSAGTDALGRAGLPGEVDRQFGERFGAAILLSVIDGAIAAGVASQQHSGNSVTISPNASESAMTEALKETQAVAPRLVKAQGDRIAVLVVRDIDFRAVLARTRDNGASEIAAGERDGNSR